MSLAFALYSAHWPLFMFEHGHSKSSAALRALGPRFRGLDALVISSSQWLVRSTDLRIAYVASGALTHRIDRVHRSHPVCPSRG